METLPAELVKTVFDFCDGYVWAAKNVCTPWRNFLDLSDYDIKGYLEKVWDYLMSDEILFDHKETTIPPRVAYILAQVENKEIDCSDFVGDVLMLAIQYDSKSLFERLIKEFECFDNIACNWAARWNRLYVLEEAEKRDVKYNDKVYTIASAYGYLDMMLWLEKKDKMRVYSDAIRMAIREGRMECLEHFYKLGYLCDESEYQEIEDAGFEIAEKVTEWYKEKQLQSV